MKDLNPAQLRAVSHPRGPLLILAGAGSGKTLVLTERFAHLVREGAARPWEVLGLTFTNKAARVLKTRLVPKLWPQADDRKVLELSRALWLGTFHSACARLLRIEANHLPAPYGQGFTIFDQSDQEVAMRDVVKAMRLDSTDFPARRALWEVSQAKNRCQSPGDLAHEARTFNDDVFAKIYERYQAHLEAQNALDYDDILSVAGRVLSESPAVLASWQSRFRHILVDEYQDTNPSQYRLVRLLAECHRNLTVVGDVDQSIYSWRAADFRIILRFEEDFPDATRITIEENYRSSTAILAVANAVIGHNQVRYPKTLKATRSKKDPVHLHCAADERDEAWWVLARLLEDTREGRSYEDVAILYRTNAQSRVFEEALGARGIPYRLVGGVKFFDRKEIRDVVAYMRLLLNPRDDIAFERIVNVPKRGIGGTTMARLRANATRSNLALLPAIAAGLLDGIGVQAANKLKAFAIACESLAARISTLSISQLVGCILIESGYIGQLEADTSIGGEARLENVRELLSRADAMFHSGEAVTLEEFLATIPLQGADDQPTESRGLNNSALGSVTLMTLHMAKGLEFPVVFLTGLEEGIFPDYRALDNQSRMEEERRLCYVGITRAADRLYISYAQSRRLAGTFRQNLPSRFLSEMPSAHLRRTDSPELERYQRAREAHFERENATRWSERMGALNKADNQAEVEWTQDFELERPQFNVGDRVVHPHFGPGAILEVMTDLRGSRTVAVEFDTLGRKLLDLAFTKLERY